MSMSAAETYFADIQDYIVQVQITPISTIVSLEMEFPGFQQLLNLTNL